MERKCTNQSFLLLMHTSKAIQDQIKDDMSKNNLSITEFSVLEVLYHKGRQTIQQIAQSILISSGSMTYVIDKLEQRGLLKRNACPGDRRASHITLTPDGEGLMEKIMPEHEDLIDSLFDSLSADEEQELIRLLRKINKFN
ncbi:MarR family transcriptional regulator [Mesobacillus subterraneus]|uniref:MarR family winged helix-turn-helix transcriptional regulator n=1 Tax=Mesobacillus subterraneus TaxID=285983 RepID=UPI0020401E32|nr:MarR family transcriptional regulator [Mesobacillus subterraneus]MCM3686120.1 MarR family transcriptional regulator [Mesobacillus subterraneus]